MMYKIFSISFWFVIVLFLNIPILSSAIESNKLKELQESTNEYYSSLLQKDKSIKAQERENIEKLLSELLIDIKKEDKKIITELSEILGNTDSYSEWFTPLKRRAISQLFFLYSYTPEFENFFNSMILKKKVHPEALWKITELYAYQMVKKGGYGKLRDSLLDIVKNRNVNPYVRLVAIRIMGGTDHMEKSIENVDRSKQYILDIHHQTASVSLAAIFAEKLFGERAFLNDLKISLEGYERTYVTIIKSIALIFAIKGRNELSEKLFNFIPAEKKKSEDLLNDPVHNKVMVGYDDMELLYQRTIRLPVSGKHRNAYLSSKYMNSIKNKEVNELELILEKMEFKDGIVIRNSLFKEILMKSIYRDDSLIHDLVMKYGNSVIGPFLTEIYLCHLWKIYSEGKGFSEISTQLNISEFLKAPYLSVPSKFRAFSLLRDSDLFRTHVIEHFGDIYLTPFTFKNLERHEMRTCLDFDFKKFVYLDDGLNAVLNDDFTQTIKALKNKEFANRIFADYIKGFERKETQLSYISNLMKSK